MPAVINNAIGSQNFELIRNQIGAILLTEFTNQAANYALPVNCTPSDVAIEGFLDFDEDTLPIVVIRLVSANEVQKDSSGNAVYEYSYYIDVFTASASTTETSGDKIATYALQKMFGIIRSILEDPRYDMLGFADGAMNIWNTHIDNWYIDLPKTNDDLADTIRGRVEFSVTATEVPSSYIGTVPVERIDTNVKLFKSDRGYYWKMLWQEINVSATGATLTNSFFTNPINKITVDGANYTLGTDFTQSGTTITATTFTFTINTTIVASTL